jgi:hypothetical protein
MKEEAGDSACCINCLARDCSLATTGEIFRSSAFFSFLQNTSFYQLQPSNLAYSHAAIAFQQSGGSPPSIFHTCGVHKSNCTKPQPDLAGCRIRAHNHQNPADHHHLAAREQLRAPKVGKSRIACRFLIKVYSAPGGS